AAWGGAGADVFVAGGGVDVIKDFQEGDRIDVSGLFRSYGALERALREEGDDVVIDLRGSGSLTVENVGALDKGDFLF
ncbi:MAG TPA: hemolysin, partial [Microvirga sp.]|nr:hemolysin [Microvirga sp.]